MFGTIKDIIGALLVASGVRLMSRETKEETATWLVMNLTDDHYDEIFDRVWVNFDKYESEESNHDELH